MIQDNNSTEFNPNPNDIDLVAKFMGWEYFPKSKRGIDGYPFGGHDGFEISQAWILNPTEKYRMDPCHYHYGYLPGNDIDMPQSDMFEEYRYELNLHKSLDDLFEIIDKLSREYKLSHTVISFKAKTFASYFNGPRNVNEKSFTKTGTLKQVLWESIVKTLKHIQCSEQ